jgi:hypothetical protein
MQVVYTYRVPDRNNKDAQDVLEIVYGFMS